VNGKSGAAAANFQLPLGHPQLAAVVRQLVGYSGEVVLDPSKPDGAPRKLLDVSRMTSLEWRRHTPLHEGVKKTYRWFVDARSRMHTELSVQPR
jgi:nucleoside-diphosphate-sugar epimerase